MDTLERYTRYAMRWECPCCCGQMFYHDEDARSFVESMMEYEDTFHGAFTIEKAREMRGHHGRNCHDCEEMFTKPD